MWKDLLSLILRVSQTGLPLPDPKDRAAVVAYLHTNEALMADVVVFVATQLSSQPKLGEGSLESAVEELKAECEDGKLGAINWAKLIQIAEAIMALLSMLKQV
jgi:hypothetical protein